MLVQRDLVFQQCLVTRCLILLVDLSLLEHFDLPLHDYNLSVQVGDILLLEVCRDLFGFVLVETPPLLLNGTL